MLFLLHSVGKTQKYSGNISIVNDRFVSRDHIGDLKTQDKDGNMLTACTDSEKAEVLGNFFASVFNLSLIHI